MKSIKKFKAIVKTSFILVLRLCLLLNLSNINAQNTTVLQGNSNYSQLSSPQGGLRYERGFYLITPKEVKANGLTNGMVINSIGFTQGVAQNNKSKGAFRVYLQNTTDLVKLIVLKCLRPDKTINAVKMFIVKHMNQTFVEPPTFDLAASYSDSNPTTPMIFILSPGSDPMDSLYSFARDNNMFDK